MVFQSKYRVIPNYVRIIYIILWWYFNLDHATTERLFTPKIKTVFIKGNISKGNLTHTQHVCNI